MTVSLKKVLQQLPKTRQNRIRKQADAYIQEYQTLQELRKSLGFTQEDIADSQGIHQVNVCNLEKRTDMRISTLARYVKAMGCTLEINIRFSDQSLARIKNLSKKHK